MGVSPIKPVQRGGIGSVNAGERIGYLRIENKRYRVTVKNATLASSPEILRKIHLIAHTQLQGISEASKIVIKQSETVITTNGNTVKKYDTLVATATKLNGHTYQTLQGNETAITADQYNQLKATLGSEARCSHVFQSIFRQPSQPQAQSFMASAASAHQEPRSPAELIDATLRALQEIRSRTTGTPDASTSQSIPLSIQSMRYSLLSILENNETHKQQAIELAAQARSECKNDLDNTLAGYANNAATNLTLENYLAQLELFARILVDSNYFENLREIEALLNKYRHEGASVPAPPPSAVPVSRAAPEPPSSADLQAPQPLATESIQTIAALGSQSLRSTKLIRQLQALSSTQVSAKMGQLVITLNPDNIITVDLQEFLRGIQDSRSPLLKERVQLLLSCLPASARSIDSDHFQVGGPVLQAAGSYEELGPLLAFSRLQTQLDQTIQACQSSKNATTSAITDQLTRAQEILNPSTSSAPTILQLTASPHSTESDNPLTSIDRTLRDIIQSPSRRYLPALQLLNSTLGRLIDTIFETNPISRDSPPTIENGAWTQETALTLPQPPASSPSFVLQESSLPVSPTVTDGLMANVQVLSSLRNTASLRAAELQRLGNSDYDAIIKEYEEISRSTLTDADALKKAYRSTLVKELRMKTSLRSFRPRPMLSPFLPASAESQPSASPPPQASPASSEGSRRSSSSSAADTASVGAVAPTDATKSPDSSESPPSVSSLTFKAAQEAVTQSWADQRRQTIIRNLADLENRAKNAETLSAVTQLLGILTSLPEIPEAYSELQDRKTALATQLKQKQRSLTEAEKKARADQIAAATAKALAEEKARAYQIAEARALALGQAQARLKTLGRGLLRHLGSSELGGITKPGCKTINAEIDQISEQFPELKLEADSIKLLILVMEFENDLKSIDETCTYDIALGRIASFKGLPKIKEWKTKINPYLEIFRFIKEHSKVLRSSSSSSSLFQQTIYETHRTTIYIQPRITENPSLQNMNRPQNRGLIQSLIDQYGLRWTSEFTTIKGDIKSKLVATLSEISRVDQSLQTVQRPAHEVSDSSTESSRIEKARQLTAEKSDLQKKRAQLSEEYLVVDLYQKFSETSRRSSSSSAAAAPDSKRK